MYFLFCKAGSFRIRMSRTFGAHKNRTFFVCVFFRFFFVYTYNIYVLKMNTHI